MSLKICSICNTEKSISEFYKNSTRKDGFQSECKICSDKRAKEKRTERRRSYSMYYSKAKFDQLKQRAEKKKLDFYLTEEEFQRWWYESMNVCFYCAINTGSYRRVRDFILEYEGDNFKINRFKKFFLNRNHWKLEWLVLDLIDSDKGYEISNLAKVCWFCKRLKGNFFTADEMIEISPRIIEDLVEEINEEEDEEINWPFKP